MRKTKKEFFDKNSFSFWQGRHDLNAQPAVLETAALPLSHSPVFATNSLMVGLHYVKRNVKIVSIYLYI